MKEIEFILGNGGTYTNQLSSVGTGLFGNKYAGTFSSDTVPKLTKSSPYAISNVDNSKQPGSHWISLCHTPKGILIYDSFGRHTRKLTPLIWKKFKTLDSDRDKEQALKEENCGARCISWLKVCESHGWENAKKI